MSSQDKKQLLVEIDQALEDIRPHLKVDGGNIEVVDVTEEGKVTIKWLGNCEFCSMSAMTMKAGVEETLRQKLPQITEVEAINGVQ